MIAIKIDMETLDIEIEGLDYVGTECIDALDRLCEILDLEVIDRTPKVEMLVMQNKNYIRG